MSRDRAAAPISTLQRVTVWVLMLLMPVAVALLAWTAAVLVNPDWGTIGLAGVEVPSESTFWIIVGSAFGLAALLSAFVLFRLPPSQVADQALMFDDLVFCPECNLRTAPDTGECQFCDAWLEGARKVTDPEPVVESDVEPVVETEPESGDEAEPGDDADPSGVAGGARPGRLERLAFWRKPDSDDGADAGPEADEADPEEAADDPDPEPELPEEAKEAEGTDEPDEPEEAEEPAEPDESDEPGRPEPPRPPIPPPDPPPAGPGDPWAGTDRPDEETPGELQFDLDDSDEEAGPGSGSGS